MPLGCLTLKAILTIPYKLETNAGCGKTYVPLTMRMVNLSLLETTTRAVPILTIMTVGAQCHWRNEAICITGLAVMYGASSTEANPSGVQGICPYGWHLPSNAEWTQLINYLGTVSDYCCDGNGNFVAKAMASQSGWQSSFNYCTPGYNQLVNNLSGFSAFPVSNYNGTPGFNAIFWSSSAESATSNLARCRTIDHNTSNVTQGLCPKDWGLSVRCLRD